MRLNHMDVAVPNVSAAAYFFQTHFDMVRLVEREAFSLLSDEEGFALVLSGLAPDELAIYPRGFHIGFNVSTAQEVHCHYQRMQRAGVPIARALSLLGGALTFQCIAPGGLLVEVGHREARVRGLSNGPETERA